MGAAAVALALLSLQPSRPTTESVYSDLCQEAQSGDIGGRYIRLVLGEGGPRVGYGATEGVIDEPIRARQVRFHARTGALSFKVTTWEGLRFSGSLADGVVSGLLRSSGGRAERVRLPKVQSLAPPYPECR